MPTSVEPMLPTPIKLPFSDSDWLFEPKLDGFRALCFLKDGKVRFLSRNKRNLTKRFLELREISSLIKARTAIIDGEIVAIDKDGMAKFDGLSRRHPECATVLYCFDLLYLDGFDLTACPLVKRKLF
jgi:bifunctional non-homologous end joining protein LigD